MHQPILFRSLIALAFISISLTSSLALPQYTAEDVRNVPQLPFFHFYPERTRANARIQQLTATNFAGVTVGQSNLSKDLTALFTKNGRTGIAASGGTYAWFYCITPQDCRDGTVKFAYATDINSSGKIVGYKTVAATGEFPENVRYHAYQYDVQTGIETDLAPNAFKMVAFALNNAGVVTGSIVTGDITADETRGYRRESNGALVRFTALGNYSYANAINQQGTIVGAYTFDFEAFLPFISTSGASMKKLPLPAGFNDGYCTGINDSGRVLGFARNIFNPNQAGPVVWENVNQSAKVTVLQTQLVTPNIKLTAPVALNEQQEMIVQGYATSGPSAGVTTAYLLKPVK